MKSPIEKTSLFDGGGVKPQNGVRPSPRPPVFKAGPDFKAMHFDSQNGHVYKAFEKCALALIKCGVEHYGAKAIFEFLRYGTAVRGKGDPFKLNNNYAAYYARKFEELNPKHKGFFSHRTKG